MPDFTIADLQALFGLPVVPAYVPPPDSGYNLDFLARRAAALRARAEHLKRRA